MSKLSASSVLSKFFDDEGEPSPDELSEDDEIDGFSVSTCSSSSEDQSDCSNYLENDKVDLVASKNTVSQSALSISQNIQPRLALKRNSRGTPSLNAYGKNPKVAKKSKISQKRTLEEETAIIFVSKIGLHGTKLNQMTIMTILGLF
jgi:hypothetical protein